MLVVESVAKIVAAGGDYRKIRFTFQEYFRRMTEDPKRWSPAFCSAYSEHMRHRSVSASRLLEEKTVCPEHSRILMYRRLWFPLLWIWLFSRRLLPPELKKPGNKLIWLRIDRDSYDLPVYDKIMEQYGKFTEDIRLHGRIVSAYALDRHGVIAGVSKMAFGNKMGVKIEHNMDPRDLFAPAFGDADCRSGRRTGGKPCRSAIPVIGEVTDRDCFEYGNVENPHG